MQLLLAWNLLWKEERELYDTHCIVFRILELLSTLSCLPAFHHTSCIVVHHVLFSINECQSPACTCTVFPRKQYLQYLEFLEVSNSDESTVLALSIRPSAVMRLTFASDSETHVVDVAEDMVRCCYLHMVAYTLARILNMTFSHLRGLENQESFGMG